MKFGASLLYARKIIFPRSSEKTNGYRSLFGAMLCIGISLIPLVAVLVVSNGMIQGITGRMIGLSSRDMCIYINPKSSAVETPEKYLESAQNLKKVNGIQNAFPEIQGIGLAAGKTSRTGATVRAVQKDIFTADKNFRELFQVVSGSTEFTEKNECIIGENIASVLNLSTGDKLRLITINSTSQRIKPKMTQLLIKGIVNCGYQELDALWVFIPLETGYSILPVDSSQYTIGVSTEDAFAKDLYILQQRLQNAIDKKKSETSIPIARVYRWDQINSSQYENFSSTQALLLLIMLLIVLVASVNISAALVMLVMERKKEIAILKSVGGSSSGISFAFLLTGLAAGTGGIFTGIPLGLLAAVNVNELITILEKIVNVFAKFIYLLSHSTAENFIEIHLLDPEFYLQKIPVSIPFDKLLIIAAGTLILSLLVSAIPAVKAGKEKPLETLRKM